jgi:hypothetical protein
MTAPAGPEPCACGRPPRLDPEVTDMLGVAVEALNQVAAGTGSPAVARAALHIIEQRLAGHLRWELVPADKPAPEAGGHVSESLNVHPGFL